MGLKVNMTLSDDKEIRWKCSACGRDTFSRPWVPHNCRHPNGGRCYRKHFRKKSGIVFLPVTFELSVAERLKND